MPESCEKRLRIHFLLLVLRPDTRTSREIPGEIDGTGCVAVVTMAWLGLHDGAQSNGREQAGADKRQEKRDRALLFQNDCFLIIA